MTIFRHDKIAAYYLICLRKSFTPVIPTAGDWPDAGEPKIRGQRMQAQPRQVKKDVKTVLIFEPDQTSLEKLSVFLKKKGFRVLSTQRPEGVEFRFNNWPKPDLSYH